MNKEIKLNMQRIQYLHWSVIDIREDTDLKARSFLEIDRETNKKILRDFQRSVLKFLICFIIVDSIGAQYFIMRSSLELK